MIFKDRAETGKRLAISLAKYKNQGVIIYALPRGGVVVGAQVARELSAPLEIVVTRKIGHPHNPEYAIAAISESGELVVNEDEVSKIDQNWFKEMIEKETVEAKRRRAAYAGKPMVSPTGKIAILVDDGVATGLTILAAIKELKKYTPKKLVVAVAVSPADTAATIDKQVDEFVCLYIDQQYRGSVGAYYSSFPQVEDSQVIEILSDKEKDQK